MSPLIKVKLDNPAILAWAREEIGLTKTDVANRFRKTEVTIDSWENGDDAPTFRQLTELANYYKRPLATFFLPSIPPSSPKPDDYRMLPGLTLGRFSKDTLIAYREVYNMIDDVQELLELLDIEIEFSLPHWTMGDDPEEKAKELRALLGITIEKQIEEMSTYYVALDMWRSVLFDHGIIVRICRIPIEDARAFCLFRNQLAGIGLSNEDREHGKIFSLFHEICHLSLRKPGVSGLASNYRSPNQDLEQYCDRFSASFLLPSSHPEVVNSLKYLSNRLTLENARSIANRFKVSKYVIIRRTLDMGFLSINAYWNIYNEWLSIDKRNKSKVSENRGGNYYATQISYNGKRYVSLVMEAMRRHYITSVDVKRFLGLTPNNIELSM